MKSLKWRLFSYFGCSGSKFTITNGTAGLLYQLLIMVHDDDMMSVKQSVTASVVKCSKFLATDPDVRVRFQALPDFLRSSGSGTGSHPAS
jgi:hypothetical protein